MKSKKSRFGASKSKKNPPAGQFAFDFFNLVPLNRKIFGLRRAIFPLTISVLAQNLPLLAGQFAFGNFRFGTSKSQNFSPAAGQFAYENLRFGTNEVGEGRGVPTNVIFNRKR